MRSKMDRMIASELRQQAELQQKIIEKYGQEFIDLAKKDLCGNCTVEGCRLLPITSWGNDCPYFNATASLSE